MSGYMPVASTAGPVDAPTTQVARDESAEVARTAADAAGQVAGTTADQARNVAQEARTQARDLLGEARNQAQLQAHNGQDKATDGLRALVRELREMAEGGQNSGPVSEVARQAADRADRAADWLSERDPSDLIVEVRSFARRRPAAFLIGAGVAGVIVGRLTRGAVDAAQAPPDVTSNGTTPVLEPAYELPAARVGRTPYDSTPDAPLIPADTVASRPYAPPVDPYDIAEAGDPLIAPPVLPVTGYTEPVYGVDPLTDEPGRPVGDLSDERYRTEYGGSR